MMRFAGVFASVLMIGLLSACEERVDSLCAKSGGSCCALSFTTDSDGNPKPSVYACTKTHQDCLKMAQEVGGSPSYPYEPNVHSERGKCEMKIKTKWAWESLALQNPLSGAAESLAGLRLRMPPAQFTTASGRTVAHNEPGFCKAVCASGDAGLCPNITVENSLSLGLLSLATDIAEAPPASSVVYSIDDVLQRFGLPPSSNFCQRGDTISGAAAFANSGDFDCETGFELGATDGNADGVIGLARLVRGTPIPAEKVAHFSDRQATMSLVTTDPRLMIYAGKLVSAAKSEDNVHISGQIDNGSGTACADVSPQVTVEHPLVLTATAYAKNPRLAERAFADLASFRNRVQSAAKGAPASDASQSRPVLLPATTMMLLFGAEAASSGVTPFADRTLIEASGVKLTSSDFIYLADVVSCGDGNAQVPLRDMMRLLPNLSRTPSLAEKRERNELAGQIIQCKLARLPLTSLQRANLRRLASAVQ